MQLPPAWLTPAPALAREILDHWSRERRTIRQGFTALGICLAVTIMAGVVLGAMEGLLERLPGLLVLVPSAIGMRGAVFGALGARLGTGMLTGQFTTDWRRDSFTVQNLEAAGLLTVATAGLSAVLARSVAAVFGLPTISLWALVVVSTVGALLSSAVVLGVVLALARTAERRSWDMDAIGTPIITATADISTLPALVVATLALRNAVAAAGMGGVLLAAAAGAAVYGLRSPGTLTRRIVSESLPVLTYAGVMGILAGTVLEARIESLVSSPALLVVIPPFIASCGALGGILSARLASLLHLGLLSPRSVPERRAWLEGSLLVLFAVVGFTAVGGLTQLSSLAVGFASPGLVTLTGVTLVGGLPAAVLLFGVAYYAATTSYRFGLDPDNYGIPMVTASMDFLGILCLVAALAILGVR
ncbi:MAG: magnesium transporter [Euzebyales bacterium]|nr:magnesium transporter [Euzebyales bacterium]MBA3622174.1 magnesium transporter [Euzebyales bacterium]